jgi:uncharacterized membrane protein
LLILGVLLGIACQLQEYARDRSYWHDEASIVLNVRSRSAAGLLKTLDYDQAAPPLFLLAERGLLKTLGDGEMSLRLLPLASGILAVIAFAILARRLLTTPWDAFATILFALSDHLITRATEVKPYISDVLVCVLLLLAATKSTPPRSAIRRMTWLAIVGVFGVAISFPAIFVFAALSLALLPEIIERNDPNASPRLSRLIAYALFNIPVALTFAAVFWISRGAQQNTTLNTEWANQFLNVHRPWAWPLWLARQLWAACDYGFPATGPAVLVGAVAGALALYRAGKMQLLAMLVGPIAMAVLGAAAHKYPFDGGRLTFFLTPCILPLAMLGFQWLYHALAGRIGYWSLAPLAYMLAVMVFWAGLHAVVTRHRDHLRPVVAYVRAHMRPADTIYTFELRVVQVYWPNADPNQLRWRLDNADRIPTRRFWIVWEFSTTRGRHQVDDTLAWARSFCREKDHIDSKGAHAVLFERNADAMPAKLQAPYRGPFEVIPW